MVNPLGDRRIDNAARWTWGRADHRLGHQRTRIGAGVQHTGDDDEPAADALALPA
jgi:hypothetical protein